MNSKNITISVIIPIYNVKEYLEEALDSILQQNMENFEIILVDDGSTDGSTKIINFYEKKNKNITIIKQKNMGQSTARNKALEVAKGKYIYFFDSDDLLGNNALELLYSHSEENKLDLIMFSGNTFGSNKHNHEKSNFNYIKMNSYKEIMTGKEIFSLLIKNNEYSPSPCLYFVKKELLEKNKIRFYDGIIHEDILFTYEVLEKSDRVKVINEILFFRRIREGSTLTQKNYFKKFMGLLTVIRIISEKNNENFLSNKAYYETTQQLISGIYGNLIRNYAYLSFKERKKLKKVLREIKQSSIKANFYNRIDYKLFYYSEFLYILSRKIFDKYKIVSNHRGRK